MGLADWEAVALLAHLITYLGDGKEYAKQGNVYGHGQFILGGEEKLLQTWLALCWCATERPKVFWELKQV